MKRYVSRYAAGSESYRELREVPEDQSVPDPDEGPFYVLLTDHEAVVEDLRMKLLYETCCCDGARSDKCTDPLQHSGQCWYRKTMARKP